MSPQPSRSDVHVNRPLTNISIAYMQSADMFVADRVFPNIPVQKQSDRYFVYEKGQWLLSEMAKRAPATESAGSGFTIDNTPNYFADVYSLHKDVDDQTRANADATIDLDRDSTRYLTHQALLQREKVWNDNYFTTSVWDTDKTGVSASPTSTQFLQWNDSASTPIEDITGASMDIASATGFKPNTLILGARVFDALRNHPDILDRIKYTQRAILTTDLLASLLDVDRVLVSMGVENSATEGATASVDFVAGKKALLAYSNPTPSILTPSAGYTFSWTGLLGAGNGGNRIKRFRMEALSADRIEIDMSFDMKVVASDLGVFFDSAVA